MYVYKSILYMKNIIYLVDTSILAEITFVSIIHL